MTLPLGETNALLVTPFDADLAFDPGSMGALVDFVIDGGAQGVVALGTTGEFFTQTPAQRAEVARRVVEMVGGRVPVTIGVGAEATATAADLARHAQDVGADCVMALPPLYFDQSVPAQVAHFTALARAVDIPVMIYDGAGGIAVPAEVIAEVAANFSHVRYAKLALPDPSRVAALRRAAPRVAALAGDDTTLAAALRAGATGTAVATSCICPGEVAQLVRAAVAGDLRRAVEISARLAPLILATSTPKAQFIVRFKEVLAAMKVIGAATVRPPLRRLADDDREELLAVLDECGLG